jgi:hypothetical protein
MSALNQCAVRCSAVLCVEAHHRNKVLPLRRPGLRRGSLGAEGQSVRCRRAGDQIPIRRVLPGNNRMVVPRPEVPGLTEGREGREGAGEAPRPGGRHMGTGRRPCWAPALTWRGIHRGLGLPARTSRRTRIFRAPTSAKNTHRALEGAVTGQEYGLSLRPVTFAAPNVYGL